MTASRIFIIGPGGVGKTTSGKILASLLGDNFIDLDQEFCDRIQNISAFIREHGYEAYCYQNSELFFKILSEVGNDNIVLSLSSGFLVHEGLESLTNKHAESLRRSGISILLLPSTSMEESAHIVVSRQLSRKLEGATLHRQQEEEKFKSRFPKYQQFGDIKIYSTKKPEIIAEHMREELNKLHTER